MARLSCLAVGVLSLVLTLPCPGEETAADVIAAANAQAAEGDETGAIVRMEHWLIDHPDDQAVKDRVQALNARRDARKQMEIARADAARSARDDQAVQVVAKADDLVAVGNSKGAIEILQTFVAEHPGDSPAKARLLRLQVAAKEAEIRDLIRQQTSSDELMLEDPDYVTARRLSTEEVQRRLKKIEYLVSEHRYTEAGQACNAILADHPDDQATLRLKFRILQTIATKERQTMLREREAHRDQGINDVIKDGTFPEEKPKVKRQVMIFDEDVNEIERAQVALRLQEKVSLTHNQAKVWDVMQTLFAIAGINYVVLDSALGDDTISLHIVDDTVESALNAISKLAKVRFAYHSGTVFVSSDANEGLVTEIIRLRSGLTDVMATVSASSFDGGGSSGGGSSSSTYGGNGNGNGFGNNGFGNNGFGNNGFGNRGANNGNNGNYNNGNGNNAAPVPKAADPAAAGGGASGAAGGSDLERFLAKIPEIIVGWPADGKIYLDRKSNSLFVRATPWAISELKRTLHALDYNNVQVLIEARFISVSEDANRELGIAWQGSSGSALQGSFGSPTAPSANPANIATNGNGALVTGVLSQGKLGLLATLKALQSEGKSDTLAEPKILTLNNQNGVIEIAENYTYIENYTTQYNSGSNQSTIENGTVVTNSTNVATPQWGSQDVGYQLKIQPSVARNSDIITLKLQPKVKELIDPGVIVNGFEYLPSSTAKDTIKKDIQKPKFSTRTLETTLHISNGKTVALGGLINETDSKNSEGTPFLKSIPILGHLFSNDTAKNKRANLIILVTATIIDPTGARVGEDIERLRDTARVLLPGTPRPDGMPATREEADALPAAGATPPAAEEGKETKSPGAPGKMRGAR